MGKDKKLLKSFSNEKLIKMMEYKFYIFCIKNDFTSKEETNIISFDIDLIIKEIMNRIFIKDDSKNNLFLYKYYEYIEEKFGEYESIRLNRFLSGLQRLIRGEILRDIDINTIKYNAQKSLEPLTNILLLDFYAFQNRKRKD